MYLVWKERIVRRLKGDSQETNTEGSFGAGYLKGRVRYHGVVHVIGLRDMRYVYVL